MARTYPVEPDLELAFQDHDRLFKELITVFLVDFLELFVPELAAEIEPESITFLDKEVFTNLADGGDHHEVDLVVRARFRGQDTFFLIHIMTTRLIPLRQTARLFYQRFRSFDRPLTA